MQTVTWLQAFAKRIGAFLLNVPVSSVHSKWWGESEKNIAAIFSLARKLAGAGLTLVVFIDEVESLLGDSPHEASTGMAMAVAAPARKRRRLGMERFIAICPLENKGISPLVT